MLIENGDGTYTGGPLDVLVILYDVNTKRFHAAFFEERLFPGPTPSVEETRSVRLVSKMHHTGGSETLHGAQRHFDELTAKILLPDSNVVRDRAFPWGGEQGVVWLLGNWRAARLKLSDIMHHADIEQPKTFWDHILEAPSF